jgi:flagellar hook-associated protein 2
MAIDLSNLYSTGTTASFAGVSSGMDTSALIQAQLARASLPQQQLKARQTANTARSTALSNLKDQMTALSSAILDLNSNSLPARTVTSSDKNDAYVTATASGGASGRYVIQVGKIATYAQLTPTVDGSGNPTNLSAASATSAIFTDNSGNGSGTATFAIQGTDGVTKQISLSAGQNNIYALADAINAAGTPDPNVVGDKGLGVTATVINTGNGSNPYELVLTSRETGVGDAGANFTIADVTDGGAVNTLGIASGSVSGSTITGGTQSNQAASNAQFTVDGVALTRASNTVDDAVEGVTFNLLQGSQTGSTTLTVAADTDTALSGMQAVVSAYNTLIKTYNTDTAASGPLAGDSTARTLIQQVQTALTRMPAGLSASSVYNSASALGLATNQDGTLTLDTAKFKKNYAANPTAAQNVFGTSSVTTNAVVSLAYASSAASAGSYGFDITSYTSGGAIAGTITAPDGTQYQLTGTNGMLIGAKDTPLEGLYLDVSGTGAGTLTISKGAGQNTIDTISNITNPASGSITKLLQSITKANKGLDTQIAMQQNYLDTLQASLQKQYSDMEAALSQLQAAGQSISSL